MLLNYDQACAHLKQKLKTPRDQAALRIILRAVSAKITEPEQRLASLKQILLARGQITLADWKATNHEKIRDDILKPSN